MHYNIHCEVTEEVIENTILGLIKNNCNVRAWEKQKGWF